LLLSNKQELPRESPHHHQQNWRVFTCKFVQDRQRKNVKHSRWGTFGENLHSSSRVDAFAVLGPFDAGFQGLCGDDGDDSNNCAAKPVEEIGEKL
jgi:hypothetical protein